MSATMLRHLMPFAGQRTGLVSVCSAHPAVLRAALRHGVDAGGPVLIEATCNQVNQEGGYTGLTPAAFRDTVLREAEAAGLPRERLVLGGDHLGPNPWRHLPPADAMQRAETLVAAYAAAGYQKLHLDCSMGCAGEPAVPGDAVAASRAARLAAVAMAAAPHPPAFVIGTEVPTPGGAAGTDGETLDHLAPTEPAAAQATYAVHRRAFEQAGVPWDGVVALVVQPGVEFGTANVAAYQPERAQSLAAVLADMPGLVFEAHSTDYQPPACLARLVQDGFAILKVGPALTFAWREALYGLDAIAAELEPGSPRLAEAMEALMLQNPAHWRGHYGGTPGQQRMQRHFSYSDRIRYYWHLPAAADAVAALFRRLSGTPVPEGLISQFLPRLYDRVRDGAVATDPAALASEAISDVLRNYAAAAGTTTSKGERA